MVFADYLIATDQVFLGSILEYEPLERHTYYRIGGQAQYVLIPSHLQDVLTALAYIQAQQLPYYILGQGSNVLISDTFYPGVVLRLNQWSRRFEIQEDVMYTGAGLLNSSAIASAAKAGIKSLEFLVGVPGSIGGAVVMNAGTHIGEVKDCLCAVDILRNGSMLHVKVSAQDFSYRKSHFLLPQDILYAAYWNIEYDEPVLIQERIKTLLALRKAKQPVTMPSCGSVFKNPYPHHAWQVIDALGLRGYTYHQAQFSEKHPNFIVNLGGAQASDVLFLIRLAQTKALDILNIALETEVIFLPLYETQNTSGIVSDV